MSFWRPSNNCIYVISDIHGMYNELKLILSRILPLRKTGGQFDKIIFLGNYLGSSQSPETLDLIIEAIKENPGQIICLCGNDDLRLLKSLDETNNNGAKEYKLWLSGGGEITLIGYQKHNARDIVNPYLIQRQSLSRHIPDNHITFIKSLLPYYQQDNCIFVHGGCDPFIPLSSQSVDVLVNDRSIFKLFKSNNKFQCKWNSVMITGGVERLPHQNIVCDKFISLDGFFDERVYVMELNTRKIFSARKNKSRLVREQ